MDIEQVLKGELDSALQNKGYLFDDCCYFRNSKSSLVYLLNFDFEEGNYRLFVGIARRAPDESQSRAPDGAYLHRYFTGGSLTTSAKEFKFKTESDLRRHLDRVKQNLEKVIFPFFDSTSTLEEYADNLSITDCMVSYEIYQELGLREKAVQQGRVVLQQHQNMRDIPKIGNKLLEIESFIAGEATALNKLLQRIKKSCAFFVR